MHLWFLHKRLISDKADNHAALLVQEELFDIFWDDTQKRIREQGVAELTVNKHLNDVQQYTFQHLTHYDHTFSEFELKPKARFEELCGVFWVHVLNREEYYESASRNVLERRTTRVGGSSRFFENARQPGQDHARSSGG
jgi:cytochrome b pre-mRNA-processing protein 3